MANENKSTTIILLVIAGALLFLIGSFSGQVTWGARKTTGLTTTQKQEVLNIFNSCMNGLLKYPLPYQATLGGASCDAYCKQLGRTCVSAHKMLDVYGSDGRFIEGIEFQCNGVFNWEPFMVENLQDGDFVLCKCC